MTDEIIDTPNPVEPDETPDPGESAPADVTAPMPAEPESTSEQRLGEFRLLRRLGKGGMAEVWLAEQTSLKRHVALKLLKRELTEDDTYVTRFEREAKAAAGLNHPNIVQVYTVGQIEGQHYIAQEYVQGQTLRNLLQKKGPLDVSVALHVMRQVAAALVAAAERGIVHRDIKPENIMITRKGEVKVADFGLAQVSHEEQLHLTQEGVTMGTPLYMSPEQVKGRKLDQRSDIYSFGVSCYHMLAGRTPFVGETAVAVAVQHLQDQPEPLGELRKDLPAPLCAIVHRMLAKDPKDRYDTAAAVLADVRRILKALKETGSANDVDIRDLSVATADAATTARTRRSVLALVGLCILVAGGGAALGWWRRTPNIIDAAKPAQTNLVDPKSTAQEQYIDAMFAGGTEDAFLAVRNYHPDPQGLWQIRATEQLALMYLRQTGRADDAQRELDSLSTFSDDPRFALEARLGEAVLAAYEDHDLRTAETILGTNESQFREHLRGGWRDLWQELEEHIADSKEQRQRPRGGAGRESPNQSS